MSWRCCFVGTTIRMPYPEANWFHFTFKSVFVSLFWRRVWFWCCTGRTSSWHWNFSSSRSWLLFTIGINCSTATIAVRPWWALSTNCFEGLIEYKSSDLNEKCSCLSTRHRSQSGLELQSVRVQNFAVKPDIHPYLKHCICTCWSLRLLDGGAGKSQYLNSIKEQLAELSWRGHLYL